MPELTTPIFVDAKGDVQLFESVREAELHMEPVDVRNAEFTVYDALGFLVTPRIDADGIHVRLAISRGTPSVPPAACRQNQHPG